MSTIPTHVQKSSRIFLIKMTTLKFLTGASKWSFKVKTIAEEGVKSRNKKCFLKCDGNLGIEMQLTIFFSIIMLGGVSQVMS